MTANGKYLYIEFVMANWVNTSGRQCKQLSTVHWPNEVRDEVNPNDLQPKTSAISKRS